MGEANVTMFMAVYHVDSRAFDGKCESDSEFSK